MISAFLFQNADDMSDTVSWRILQQDMYMVFICLHSLDIPMMAFCRFKEHLFYVDSKEAPLRAGKSPSHPGASKTFWERAREKSNASPADPYHF
jgi:hypothetical protein